MFKFFSHDNPFFNIFCSEFCSKAEIFFSAFFAFQVEKCHAYFDSSQEFHSFLLLWNDSRFRHVMFIFVLGKIADKLCASYTKAAPKVFFFFFWIINTSRVYCSVGKTNVHTSVIQPFLHLCVYLRELHDTLAITNAVIFEESKPVSGYIFFIPHNTAVLHHNCYFFLYSSSWNLWNRVTNIVKKWRKKCRLIRTRK